MPYKRISASRSSSNEFAAPDWGSVAKDVQNMLRELFFAEQRDLTDVVYFLSERDNMSWLTFTSASTVFVIIPNNLPWKWSCLIDQEGPGQVQFITQTGATIDGIGSPNAISAQKGKASLFCKRNVNGVSAVVSLSGDLLNTSVPLAPVNTVLPGAPSGTADTSSTLSAVPGTWAGTAPLILSYQWYSVTIDGREQILEGRNVSNYAPNDNDIGKQLFYEETAKNAYGSATKRSALTSTVLKSAIVLPVPGPVSSLVLSTPTADGFTATYAAASNATYYEKRTSSDGGVTWSAWTLIGPSPATLTGLTASTSYTVQVRGANSSGVGASAQATGTTGTAGTVPGTVASVALSSPTTSGFTVTYSAASGATSYEYRTSADGGTTWTSWTGIAASPTTITGLTSATNYIVQVRGVNGTGPGTAGQGTGTTASAGSPPGAVATVTLSSPTTSGFTVTYSAASGATGYEYRTSANAGSTWSSWSSIGASPAAISGLSSNTAYLVEVRGTNGSGAGTAGQGSGTTASGGGYSFTNTEAATLVAAMPTQPDDTRKAEIDTLIGSLKSGAISGSNIWNKLDFFEVFAAHASDSARINWKSPGTRDAVLVGTPTFTTDRGYTMASGSYVDTSYNPASHASNFALNSGMFAVWNRSTGTQSSGIGGFFDGTNGITVQSRNASNQASVRVNQASAVTASNSSANGLIAAQRGGSTSVNLRRNGTIIASGSTASSSVPSGTLLCGTVTAGGGIAVEIAAAMAGASLSADENTDLYNAIQAFMTAIGA